MRHNLTPLVSIIMNCLNGEKFLKSSINSIILQSYKNWELIFYDNCSQDNSLKLVKSFKDKRIKIFKSKKLLRLYDARNFALSKAKGKYVSFLDVDDFWNKEKLKIQINYLKKNTSFKILYTNYFIKNDMKNSKKKKFRKKLKSGYITQKLLDDYSIGILTIILEKKLFEKHRFNKIYNIIGDFDCFLKLSLLNKIGYLKKPLATYRVHNNNYTNKYFNRYIHELDNWISKNKTFFQNKKYSLFKLEYYLKKLKIKFFVKKTLGV